MCKYFDIFWLPCLLSLSCFFVHILFDSVLWEEKKTKLSRINPGGVLRFELDRGVPLEPQNLYPSLRVILAEKGTHF